MGLGPAIRAVCFDVGGVLIEIAYDWGETLAKPQATGDMITSCSFLLDYQRGVLDEKAYLAAVALHLGVDLDEALRCHDRMLKRPMPGMDVLVRELKSAGVVVGCLSNTNEPHWIEMFDSGRFAAMEELEVRLASHRIGASKPSDAAFRAFQDACGLSPEEILLFDDIESHCVAAREFGWQSMLVDPHNDPASQMRRHLGLD